MSALWIPLYTLLLSFWPALPIENHSVRTPRGAELSYTTQAPSLSFGKSPALVVVPGRLYHKDLPIFDRLGLIAPQRGFLVFRFNWLGFTANPERPSRSRRFRDEFEDLRSVLDQAKADPRVDPDRIVLVAKSVGSVLSYALLRKHADVRGLAILTPLCNDTETGMVKTGHSYPLLDQIEKPILFALGDADPNCHVEALRELVAGAHPEDLASMQVFGGNHYLTFGKTINEPIDDKDRANIDEAMKAVVAWSRGVLDAR